jgi:uncharacterized protein (UPF0332 family)
MNSLDWCKKQKNGIEIVEPNENMSSSYIKMAEESITILHKITESKIWTATTSYYIYYYSLYSFMLRLGVKCEIHSCSILFMKNRLQKYYSKNDVQEFGNAFKARMDLQYYADRPIDQEIINNSAKQCKLFFIKTKNILAKISEKEIEEIRSKV